MALPINIEDLLRKNKVESNRIEFKKGWNPDEIFRTICAFATDFEDTGGGYILIGVEQDEGGMAKRPVMGLPLESIDAINKKMVNYENKIYPRYLCKTSVEEVDGKYIYVIWAPSGINRPYCVCENVTVKKSPQKFYVRSKASTIEAKGEILDQVRDLATRIPFDERGNEAITIDDISGTLVYEHLKAVGSKLRENFHIRPLQDILEAMDLLTGPTERRVIKNVAAMMFCDHPEKFFPVTQVDIVHFPEGSIENPDYIIEASKIVGPVPKMIADALSYIRTNVIKQRIVKPEDNERSIKVFNYPYQAFEESIVNCLYHRDYQEREPVEITIEPDHVDILSYAGPDRSISAEAIRAAKKLKARRYRNRRLGDFLKELDLTEGRSTGIPTIQRHLTLNGNAPATIETDEDRTYFLITIPCREDMVETSTTTVTEDSTTSDKLAQLVVKVQNSFNHEVKRTLDLFEQELGQDTLQLVQSIVKVLDVVNKQYNPMLIGGLLQFIADLYSVEYKNHRYKNDWKKLIQNTTLTVAVLHGGEPMTIRQLFSLSDFDKDYAYRRKILEPLIACSYVERTIPDKPNSSKQQYRLTDKSRKLFEE
ncbi:MAG: putative DNA binding domain-containing protein [Bacteroidales bacterium]|nr:putative DNA binding domain-containing protein [Bacteroidales bacterium]